MAKLTTAARKRLSAKSFVYRRERRYPIHDRSHAASALSRVSQHGTPAEKRRVRSAVYAKYPDMGKGGKKRKTYQYRRKGH